MHDPRSILITGASSGIGEALALAYAGPGVSLALSGRDPKRLAAVAGACMDRGAQLRTDVVDVANRDATAKWIVDVDGGAPVDLVIANAGVGGGTDDGHEDATQTRGIFAVNLDGVLNTVLPLIPRFVERRRGQIALMSSLASFRGFPGAPTYCGSKAAVRVWGEGLRGDLAKSGVEVSVVCPGFVVSRMTAQNKFPMPFLMSGERAAAIVKRGLARNRGRIAFPWPMYAAVWFVAGLPPLLTDSLFARLPKKH
ncbi:MAG TPA: SDR family NAD(P)-dependent oxidoreductase [Rhizomicrobium sp.]|nr:SDR family NAD(P)-dependent oxidoreductase [Rhizomicrobium sp.]